MKVWHLLKPEMLELRQEMARKYRELRLTDPAKARLLFQRISRVRALAEYHLMENLYGQTNPDHPRR